MCRVTLGLRLRTVAYLGFVKGGGGREGVRGGERLLCQQKRRKRNDLGVLSGYSGYSPGSRGTHRVFSGFSGYSPGFRLVHTGYSPGLRRGAPTGRAEQKKLVFFLFIHFLFYSYFWGWGRRGGGRVCVCVNQLKNQ